MIINFVTGWIASRHLREKMARAGIYPGPICQILNLLYSLFPSFMMIHPITSRKSEGENKLPKLSSEFGHLVKICLDARREPFQICSSRKGERESGAHRARNWGRIWCLGSSALVPWFSQSQPPPRWCLPIHSPLSAAFEAALLLCSL